MDPITLQSGLGFGLVSVGLLFLLLVVITLWQSFEIVDAYEKKTLTVFGEYRKLLEPGSTSFHRSSPAPTRSICGPRRWTFPAKKRSRGTTRR